MNTRKFLLSLILPLLAVSFLAAQQAPAFATPELAAADGYVKGLQYLELKKAVAAMSASRERDYFAGVLANREGRLDEAISLLEKAIPEIRKTSPSRTAVALEALGDSYVKQYRYVDAVRAYEDLLQHFEANIDKAMLGDDKDDYSTFKLLKNAPPQTVDVNGPVALKTHRNPVLKTIETRLKVNGVEESWILDTGANFSVVSASMAERLKLKPLPGEAQTQGITGAENKLRVALLPELNLGGATVRNVVLLVLEDASLQMPLRKGDPYQINAILGYPVMHALGKITFTHDGRFLADPKAELSKAGAPLLMQKLMPMLLCQVEGRDLLFAFDSGATSSAFSNRYQREFPEQFQGLNKQPYAIGGAGGVRRFETYYLPAATLAMGGTPVMLKRVPVLPELGTSLDLSFGNLGRDVTDQYESFSMDFRSMRFELGKELDPKVQPVSPE